MYGLTLLCRGGGVRISVLEYLFKKFLVALVLGTGVSVGGVVWVVYMAGWGSFVGGYWLCCRCYVFDVVCAAWVYIYICVVCCLSCVHLCLL